jgi:hypothetical protein
MLRNRSGEGDRRFSTESCRQSIRFSACGGTGCSVAARCDHHRQAGYRASLAPSRPSRVYDPDPPCSVPGLEDVSAQSRCRNPFQHSRIDKKGPALSLNARLVRMTEDESGKSRGIRVEIKLRQVMQDIDPVAANLDHVGSGKSARPSVCVVIPTHRSDRRDATARRALPLTLRGGTQDHRQPLVGAAVLRAASTGQSAPGLSRMQSLRLSGRFSVGIAEYVLEIFHAAFENFSHTCNPARAQFVG